MGEGRGGDAGGGVASGAERADREERTGNY